MSELSNQIASLQANIKAFEGNADFKSALEKKEFPFSNIDTVFNSYNPGETLEESTITENQLEAVNTNIEAIIDLVEKRHIRSTQREEKTLVDSFYYEPY